MARRAFTVMAILALCIWMVGCGQSYELQSITVSTSLNGTGSSFNLEGMDDTKQLVVTAHYSNTKSEDVTVHSTYEIGAAPSDAPYAPSNGVTISSTGIIQDPVTDSAGDYACTWITTPTNVACTEFAYGSAPYPLTVTYKGKTATGSISVDNGG